MRKRLLACATLVLLIVVLAACGRAGPSPTTLPTVLPTPAAPANRSAGDPYAPALGNAG